MPTLNAFDAYNGSQLDPVQMKAAGITIMARYLWQGGKGTTRAEIDADHAAGIGVALNYEASSGNHLLGAAQGATDGAAARALAAALGAPAGLPIYFSCDQQVSNAMLPVVMAYLRAADSAAHPSRCYGQKSVCDAFGRPAWQTIAWSGGEVSARAALYQYQINQTFYQHPNANYPQSAVGVDYNSVLDLDALGAWMPSGYSPSGSGTPITGDDDDMPLNDADKAWINAAVTGQLNEYFANGEGNPTTGRIFQAVTNAAKIYFATGEGNPITGRIVQACQKALKLGPSA